MLTDLIKRSWPFQHLVRKRIGFAPNDIQPVDIEIIAPAEEIDVPKSVFLEGQLDRIRPMHASYLRTHRFVDPAVEVRRLVGPVSREGAIERHWYRDVLVHRWGFCSARAQHRLMGRPEWQNLFQDDLVTLLRSDYCTQLPSYRYFGHWLFDGCAAALITEPGASALLPIPRGWHHPHEYLGLMGLEIHQDRLALVEELGVIHDLSMGSSKQRRIQELRRRVRGALTASGREGRPVWIHRSDQQDGRVILNEDRVLEELEHAGFDILFPMEMSAIGIIERLRSAPVIAGLEGSHLFHGMFAAPAGALVLAVIPCDRFLTIHATSARVAGLRSGVVVMQGTFDTGYRVDVTEILKTLELARLW